MRVSVFDPHPVVHQALTLLLPPNGFSVVSQSQDGRGAVSIVREAQADIVITDIRMPTIDGLKVLEALCDAGLKVRSLVFTADSNPTFVARAIAYGAQDYILKTDPQETLGKRLEPHFPITTGRKKRTVCGSPRQNEKP